MEFLKRSVLQARAFLDQLGPSQKWLIGSLLIVLLLSSYLILQYAARPEWVPITHFAIDRIGEVTTRLEQEGIQIESRNGQIFVPKGRHVDALFVLQQSDLLADDMSTAFDEVMQSRSPWRSSDQNRQDMLIATQKVCAAVLSKIEGVRSADVVISMPEQKGFGRTFQRPTASVNIVTEGRRKVDKALVEAAAAFVSGAVAEMTEQDVVVIDAKNGRRHRVNDPGTEMPSETLAHQKLIENSYKQNIEGILEHIVGVKVAVNVQVNPLRTKQTTKTEYLSEQPLKSEFDEAEERTDQSQGGEPGARSNTGIDIETGGGTATSFTREESLVEYREKPIVTREQSSEVGHGPMAVNVSVGVPRSYFVALYMQDKPEEQAPPDDTTLQPIIDEQRATITKRVDPLIRAEQRGDLVVEMFHDFAQAGDGQVEPRGLRMLVSRPWAKPAGLVALALVSLALMFGMVRKATQQPPLPSIEELAGVPPQLLGEEDLTGMAEETDHAMGGVEIDEDTMESRKMAEQIGEMIRSSPVEASNLINKWIRPPE